MAVERVSLFTNRLLRQTETDHVRDDHPPSGLDKRTDDIAVQESPRRVAVQEHNRVAPSSM
jgi:hypothetical protein